MRIVIKKGSAADRKRNSGSVYRSLNLACFFSCQKVHKSSLRFDDCLFWLQWRGDCGVKHEISVILKDFKIARNIMVFGLFE